MPTTEPAERVEVLAALLADIGLAWPLARALAIWMQAIEASRIGERSELLEAIRISTVVLSDWIEEGEVNTMGLRDACSSSLDLVDALDEQDECLVERRRLRAWVALRALAAGFRALQPSPWVRRHGLGW